MTQRPDKAMATLPDGASRRQTTSEGSIGRTLIVIPTRGMRPLEPLVQEVQRQMRQLSGVAELVILSNGSRRPSVPRDTSATRVEHVTIAGLATVRNHALDLAEDFDRLVFIDDDEMPGPNWLSALIAAEHRWAADVVVGPVRVRVPASAPKWLGDGELLRSHNLAPDGPMTGPAYSGNTLLGTRVLGNRRLRFDTEFNYSGGEDTEFFGRLNRLGFQTVMTREGQVEEFPDLDRLSLAGVLRKSFNGGSVHWRATCSERSRVRQLVRRSGRLLRGSGLVATGLVSMNASRCVKGLMDVAVALGTWSAVLGARTDFYR
jgi:succinoglycan biosynthesis protein ExoM